MAGLSIEGPVQWDCISAMPLPHMSFMMRKYLPVYSIHSMDKRTEILDSYAKHVTVPDNMELLLSGSAAEGLDLPDIVVTDGKGEVSILQADHDGMVISHEAAISEDPRTAPLLLQTENLHPGYTRIRIANPDIDRHLFPKTRSTLGDPEICYVNSTKVTNLFHKELSNMYPATCIDLQGPAMTDKEFGRDVSLSKVEKRKLKVKQNVIREQGMDMVISVPVMKWPSAAKEWTDRPRRGGWPSQNIVEDIITKGCHVVCVGHAHSSNKDLEWRMSFSQAECVLAASLTSVQKQCYLLFKTLHLYALKQPKAIVTYHLKTVFFWAAEEVPQCMWTEDRVTSMLIYLLDKLIHCLTHHNLPSYFIPSNNLIDTVPVDVIHFLKLKVCKVRQDPMGTLFRFNKMHKFVEFDPSYYGDREDMETIMAPVIRDIPMATLLSKSLIQVFMPVCHNLAAIYMNERDLPYIHDKAALPETLPFDHAIHIYTDLTRMVNNIIFPKRHIQKTPS